MKTNDEIVELITENHKGYLRVFNEITKNFDKVFRRFDAQDSKFLGIEERLENIEKLLNRPLTPGEWESVKTIIKDLITNQIDPTLRDILRRIEALEQR